MIDQLAPFHRERPPGGPKSPAEMELSGLQRTQRDVEGTGTKPPIHYLTGLRPTAARRGFMAFSVPITEWLLSARGEVPTMALSFLADAAVGGAAMTVMPPRTAIPTVELSLFYLEPVGPTQGEIEARGSFLIQDAVTAVSRVELRHQDRLLAAGLTRVMIEPALVLVPEAGGNGMTEPYRQPVVGQPVPAETWASRPGLEILEDQISGRLPLPPLWWLFGLRPSTASEGTFSGRVFASPWSASPAGTIYGGFVAAALEWAICSATRTVVPPGGREQMLDLKVNYLRPLVPEGQDLEVRADLFHRGRRIVVGQAALAREDHKVIARASATARLE